MKCLFSRKLLPAFFTLFLLLNLFPVSVAFATETGTTNTKVVLRSESSKTSTALQTIPEGEEITVIRTSGDWFRVRYGNFTGYIMKQYIELSASSVLENQDAIDDLGDAPGPLYIGDEGPDVKKLQKALMILGYYDLRADGIYGNGTTTAVALFQQACDLEPDGIAGKQTIKAIFGSCASSADITVSGRDEQEAEAETTSADDTTDSTLNVVDSFSEIGSAPSPSKEGDSGTDVIKLQQALYLLGYFTGVIDGDFGEITKNAVIRFQKNRGMNEDGIAGASTIRVLFTGTSGGHIFHVSFLVRQL